MNGHASTNDAAHAEQFDVLIVGSGLSGINAAYRVQEGLPDAKYAVLEGRHELGGTWSQFQYPGVRSDSDLHTLGFQFYPWQSSNPIASGGSIMSYLHETAEKFDLKSKIRYSHKVVAADWRSSEQRWRLEVDVGGGNQDQASRRIIYWTKWIIMGTGYYSYETPAKARIPGLERFRGQTIHPQFWPKDLEYKDKKMIIIGSGATTITLLPALIDGGAGSVTQLQRSPSYIMSLPQDNDAWWEKYAPLWFVRKYKRFMFTLVPIIMYKFCMWFPTRAAKVLQRRAQSQLPKDIAIDPHFKPGYNPWQQRLCLCPDGDYFKAFNSGRAHIRTDTIKSVVEDGIQLDSGEKLDADIIITATGLNLRFLGGVDLSIDGTKVDLPAQFMWRFSMLTSLPNLGNIIGFWNASWTLGSDTASRLFVRIIQQMNKGGYTSVVADISDADRELEVQASPLNSTYITNSMSLMPKCADRGPWKPRDNYFVDKWGATQGDLNDGLKWEKIST